MGLIVNSVEDGEHRFLVAGHQLQIRLHVELRLRLEALGHEEPEQLASANIIRPEGCRQ